MKFNKKGLDLIKQFESCRLDAYPDPATGGAPWTIGWGHCGPEVYKGVSWTQQECDDMLSKDVGRMRAAIDKHIKVNLTDNQYSAVISLVYNIGPGNFIGHDLLKSLNAGETKKAADEFPKWNKAAGKVLAGLIKRREAEQKLFLS